MVKDVAQLVVNERRQDENDRKNILDFTPIM